MGLLTLIIASFTAFVLLAVYQVYRFIIRPSIQLSFYKKQGLKGNVVPFYGYLKQVAIDLHQRDDILYSWKQVNNQKPKPKAFLSNFGDKPLIALKDPELIKQFFVNQEKCYIKLPDAVNVAKIILRNGTILAEGETWKAHRKLSSPLYSYDTAQAMVPEIVQIVEERFDVLKGKDLNNVDFLTEVQHILAEVIGRIFLGLDLHKLQFKGQTVSAFVAELIDRSGLEAFDPFTLLFTVHSVNFKIHPRHRQIVQDIQDLRAFLLGAAKARLGEILADKEKGVNQTQKPRLLLLIYEQMTKFPEGSLDAVDLVDEFANFVLGAMDTTSHSIIFGSYFHLNSPSSQKKLLEEVDRVFSDPSKITIDTLNQMDYLSAVLKETLRLAAPLPNLLPRIAVKDHQLGNLQIKQGTVVSVASVTNSFDPDYHDDPETFNPGRWLDENSKTRKSVSQNAYVYIPFSTGHRVCSGQQLGTNLFKIVLGVFLKKFNYSHSDKNYKMVFASKFFSEPLHSLTYKLEPRK